ncbi:hypothetical protein [Nocardioides bruguierae]|uniref:Uncharacterized protein n=1 Tax=Nocardioides bruguierae TaxID=2945102 RepID=A0A9X2IEX2_9ACTN|nr:hypothetical protein [Nocardioides bruguierae]MCM0620513.1 hypothetical protein [Nocardioides bruguierae]
MHDDRTAPRRSAAFLTSLRVALAGLLVLAAASDGGARRDDRGDVPGWVMVTVMTAGIVAAISAFAGPVMADMVRAALDSVQ